MAWKIVTIACVGLLAMFALTGCCPWLGEEAAEEAFEQSTGGDVEIDDDGDSVTIETDEGSAQISGGDSAEVPADFPSSMPIYDGTLTVASSVEMPEGNVYTLGIETDDSIGDVQTWYKDELQAEGWTIMSEVNNDQAGQAMTAFVVEGDAGQGTVTVAEEDGKTVIAVSVTSGM